MTTVLTAYVGRDNEERLALLIDGSAITAQSATGATFQFDSYCINTDTDTDEIYFLDSNNQTVCLKIGLISGLTAGTYSDAHLTIYDASNTNGIAWDSFTVRVYDWDVCS